MLEAMRGTVAKIVIRILAFFLILSFAVWGIGDMFRGRSAPSDVAEVGGFKISGQELNREFRRAVDNLRERLGSQFDATQARQLGVLDQILQQLITNRLFALETARLGLDAGNDMVRSIIASDPAFQSQAGRFDAEVFRRALSRENKSEAGYVASLRSDVVRLQLTGSFAAGAVVPKKLHQLVYDFRNERRVADVVRISKQSVAAPGEPTELQVTEFHSKNPAPFTAPEYREVTVAHFDPMAMAAEIRIPEKRLREEYEYRLPTLSVPERRELQQILVRDEAVAKKAHAELSQGRDFTKVATETAKLSTGALSLGNLARFDLPKEIADVAFALSQGGFSKPVKSALGWHILKTLKITGGKVAEFEEVRKTINADLAREKAIDALVEIANRFEDALAGGASLEEGAARVDATLIQIPAIHARGADKAGKQVATAPADPKFLQTVFATASGMTSVLTETNDGGYFMVRVNGVKPPALRPLAEVRAKVISAWKTGQRGKQAKIQAEAILAAAKAKSSLAAAAKDRKLKLETSKPFSRFIQDPLSPLPPSLMGSMFKLAKGGMAIAAYDDGYAVAELESIERKRPDENAEEFKNIGNSLLTAVAGDIVNQLADSLRQRYKVTIDPQAIEALF